MQIKEALAGFQLPLSDDAFLRLQAFHELLMDKNQVMDLTNVPESDMPIRHYADSLLPLSLGLFKKGASLIDVGTGAGFPGVPLAIARPDIKVTLLESMQKRCAFLEEAIATLGLNNARVVNGRAEDLARQPQLRERFDLALARAVAALPTLLEYLLPFVKPGGQALCWKGPALQEELTQGEAAARLLGGKLGPCHTLPIPERTHLIQVIDKIAVTPKKYPRKTGLPGKMPLG